MMFVKKGDDFTMTGGLGRSRNPHLSLGSKAVLSRTADKSAMRSRVFQKTFSNIDLNLNALTKEL